ncbi:hypothetical protein BDV96DRAFT_640357 [Lophiotrema nucula]|uniref:Uncharacterized protein n=1 Tax=Lophiotrema nucula TaxID=690887 RepID=A0A6A5ZVD7_9PLEO|nr:hypothetical protein BDV96DRAFT_640357 [Lophiotrema nucula]
MEDGKGKKRGNIGAGKGIELQGQNLWFTLPGELREMVYEKLFKKEIVVVFQEGMLEKWSVKKLETIDKEENGEIRSVEKSTGVLSLLLTCLLFYFTTGITI